MRKPELAVWCLHHIKAVVCMLILGILLCAPSSIKAQCALTPNSIKGFIFNDSDFDGQFGTSDALVGNVVVSAYDASDQLVSQVISNVTSGYELTNLNDGEIYRVEFNYSSQYELVSTADAALTNVRFVSSPACDQALGLHKPSEFCEENPEIAVACFVRGAMNTLSGLETIVALEHNFSDPTVVRKLDSKANTGSVHGLVFRQESQEIFSTAFVKQYAALAQGPGAIYKTKFSRTGAIQSELFIRMLDLGISVGNMTQFDQDQCDYGYQVGKVGLGDITLSADHAQLYVSNQSNNSIVELDVINPTAATTQSYSVPDPGCADGDFNVFALEEHDGLIYVGCTCTAETSKDPSKSEAVIYEFDPNSGSFNMIFRNNKIRGFWKDDMSQHLDTAHWVTDLAFTDDGNILLGLSDRMGHTHCNGTDGRTDQQFPDMLVVWNDNGTWRLESNGTAGALTGSGVSNGQGPDGGEFFNDEWSYNPILHPEILLGTMLTFEGKSQVIATSYDPLDDAYSGGLIRFNTNDGAFVSGKELYIREFGTYFGKATGFGDLDVICGAKNITIGNLAWIDDDNDGIQDPGEQGLADMKICLFDDQGNKVGETLTDANGHYLFDWSNVDLDSDGTFEGPEFNEQYYLAICDARFNKDNNTLARTSDVFALTLMNSDGGSSSLGLDHIDSDVSIYDGDLAALEGCPVIPVFTGGNGNNDYSYDFGFTEDICFDLALRKTLASESTIAIGDTVEFLITIYNQGLADATDIAVVDYLNQGYEFLADLNDGWRYDDSDEIAKIEIDQNISVGDSATVSIFLRVTEDANYGNLVNIAEISTATDVLGLGLQDKDSTPDDNPFNDAAIIPFAEDEVGTNDEITDAGDTDEDDHDFERVGFLDLALIKLVADQREFFSPGEMVPYEIIIFNQGSVAAMDIEISDYLPESLWFLPDSNPDWTMVNDSTIVYNVNDILPSGASDTITIDLMVNPSFDGTEIINHAEISNARSVTNGLTKDFDSTPDRVFGNDKGGEPGTGTDNAINADRQADEDDEDPAKIKTRFFDLALTKITTSTVVTPGGNITFDITVTNQGTTPADNILITDYIPVGTTLADANWMSNIAGTQATITLASTNGLLPILGLLPGSTVTVAITLTVNTDATLGAYINAAEISAATDELGTDMSNTDIDSNADQIDGNDIGGTVNSSEDDHIDDDGADTNADGITDEDDHDPEDFFVIGAGVQNACTCLDNATPTMVGQYQDDVLIQGPCGQAWTVVLTDITATPVGTVLTEAMTGTPGLCQYTLPVVHDSGLGYSITIENSNGEQQIITNRSCAEYSMPVCLGETSVCLTSMNEYLIPNPDAASTYTWAVPAGTGTLSAPTGATVTIDWTAIGTHQVTITETNPAVGFCSAPLVKDVNVGNPGGSIICHHDLNFSLDENCELVVTPEVLSADPINPNIPYIVILTDALENVVPNATLTSEHVGQVISAKLMDGCSGNSCWGTITVEDKLAPTVICPVGPMQVTCQDIMIFVPDFIDNCDPNPTVEILSERLIKGDCDGNILKVIERIYKATDKSGNMSLSCPITIEVIRPVLTDIVPPEDYLKEDNRALTCDNYPVDANGNPDPSATGVPTLNGMDVYPSSQDNPCKIGSSYSDEVIFEDDCFTKIIRTWLIADECSDFTNVIRLTQSIQITDPVSPTITCPHDFTVATNGYSCEALVNLPMPVAEDNCSSTIRFQLQYEYGFIDNWTGGSITLPAGRHRVEYGAFDGCHNEVWCWFYVTVEDKTPPVAICDQHTSVTLVNNVDYVHVPAVTFDDGTFDDCLLDRFLARRMDPNCDCDIPSFNEMHYLGEFDGHHYYLSDDQLFANKAIKMSEAFGGYSANIDSEDENDWLTAAVIAAHGPVDFVLGYTDVMHDGLFEWTEGESSYDNWAAGEPASTTGDYTMMNIADGTWSVYTGLSVPKYFVVELEDVCGFSDAVEFCCTDAGEEHAVVFRAVDKWGNFNDCMVTVEVQDKTPPVILCPADTTITCDSYLDLSNTINVGLSEIIDLSQFGMPTVTDNCSFRLTELQPDIDINSCNVGTIVRSFIARDANSSVQCEQTITIVADNLIDLNDVDFPDNFTVSNSCDANELLPENLPDSLGMPLFFEDECNLVGINYEDQVFPFAGGDACLKIIRTWTIINWCDPTTLDAPLVHLQEIKLNNTIAPTIELLTTELDVCTFDNNCEQGFISLLAQADDDCTPTEDLMFVYTIDLFSDGTIDIINSGFGSNIDASGNYPIGTHVIVFETEDRCGNAVGTETSFTITNCKTPTAACIGKLTVTIEPMDFDGDNVPDTEAACIFASAFDASSFHPCGGEVTMSFDPDVIIEKDTVGCGAVGTNAITIYVHDQYGNVDECQVELCVQNNSPDFCPDPKECIIFPEDIEISVCAFEDLDPETIGSSFTVSDDCFYDMDDFNVRHFDTSTIDDDGCEVITRTLIIFFGNLEICRDTQMIRLLNSANGPLEIDCNQVKLTFNVSESCDMFVTVSNPEVTSACHSGLVLTNDSPFADDPSMSASGTYPVGATEITYTIMDECGNSAQCTVVVTIVDVGVPICETQDITVNLDENGLATVTIDDLNISASDLCDDDLTVEISNTTFSCEDVLEGGQVDVVITDSAGNSTECTVDVTVIDDDLPPICRAEDITVSLDANGNATISAQDIGGTSTDGCFGTLPNLDIDITDFDCTNLRRDVVVTLTVSDNTGFSSSCTADVTVLDEIAPVCTLEDITVSLGNNGMVTVTLNDLGYEASDNCQNNPIAVFNQTYDCDDLGNNTVTVTVSDRSDNESTCTATVTVVDETSLPMCVPEDITVSLDENGFVQIDPLAIAGNSTDGCDGATPEISIEPSVLGCNNLGPNVITITLTDDDGNTTTCTAEVMVVDDMAPICDVNDITVSLDASGEVNVTFADFDNGSSDNCSSIFDVDISDMDFSCTELGTQEVTITLTDMSGNETVCTADVTVDSDLSPECIVQDVTVNLDENGQAAITPDLVDNGSFDPCGQDITLTVMPAMVFCNDIGTLTYTFTVTDEDGNESICTGNITVVDVIPPMLTCPPNVTISCDESIDDLSVFGAPEILEECAVGSVVEEVSMNLNTCNIGLIERTFIVTDGSGNISECTQVIQVTGGDNAISLDDITFPPLEVNLDDCGSLDPEDLPGGATTVDESGAECSSIVIDFVDVNVTPTIGNRCPATIERTWTVIDSCQLDGTGSGVFVFTQTITVDDTMAPVIADPDDIIINLPPGVCDTMITDFAALITDCDQNLTVTNDSPFADDNDSGDLSGTYGAGLFNITITASDFCGNVSTAAVTVNIIPSDESSFSCMKVVFDIEDGSPPGVLVNINDIVTITQSACDGQSFIDASFSSTNPDDDTRFFGCNSEGDVDVQTFFFQDGVLIDNCFRLLTFVDDFPGVFCNGIDSPDDEFANISGSVFTEDNEGVENVMIELQGADQSKMTDTNGEYAFPQMPTGGEYEIMPYKNDNALNGVSTLDLIMIQKHILGVDLLDSPYKIIAADINNSRSISAADLVDLRKIILGIENEFPNNTSWRMVDADYSFADPLNPLRENFNESYDIYSLDNNMLIDFIGVKTGDVNNSAAANQYTYIENRDLTNNLQFLVTIRELADQKVAYDFQAKNYTELLGFQFSLEFNQEDVMFENLMPGALAVTADNVGVGFENRGLISFSYNDDAPVTKGDDEVLFSLVFQQFEVEAAHELAIVDDITQAEAYTENTTTGVSIGFMGEISDVDKLSLYQNTPNPWSDKTTIGFYVPRSMEAELIFFDITGRVIHTVKGDYNKGFHNVDISRNDLDVSGLIYYELRNEDERLMQKMLLLK